MNLHRCEQDDGTPPWGQQREALTPSERSNLYWLIGGCLACDAALMLLLAGALG